MSRRSLFERGYRAGLLIFPPTFRAEFGDEMVDFARRRVRSARRRGGVACVAESVRLFADLVASAPSQWIAHHRERRIAKHIAIEADVLPRDNMDIFIQDLRFAVRGL